MWSWNRGIIEEQKNNKYLYSFTSRKKTIEIVLKYFVKTFLINFFFPLKKISISYFEIVFGETERKL